MSQDYRKFIVTFPKAILLNAAKWIMKTFPQDEQEIGTHPDNRYPEGVDYFRDATFIMYKEGLEEWQHITSTNSHTWANYMAFLSTGWYQDGLMAWRNTAWRNKKEFKSVYKEVTQSIGVDFKIEWRTHVLLYFANLAKETPGVFIEFGTGKGWMATAITASGILEVSNKTMYLFDTFEPEKVDHSSGKRNSSETDPHYATNISSISPILLSDERVFCVVGDVRQTLHSQLMLLEDIAFVHFDLNSANIEEVCFRLVYPKLRKGCVIVLDDYGFVNLEMQQVTWDNLALEFNFSILSLPTGQGIIVL
jgi:hypothetical protein